MDEKEKELNEAVELNNDESTASNETEILDSSLEERDGVKYETEDNWVFEAEAPTLNDDMFEGEINIAPAKNTVDSKKEPKDNDDISNSTGKELLKFIPLAVIMAVVITVLVVLGVRYNTVPNGKEGDKANPAGIAMTVDKNNVSVGLYNLYFSSVASQYEQYAQYGYYDLDLTKDYSQQNTTDENGITISWFNLFKKRTEEQIRTYFAYCDAAKEAGITLSDKQKEIIEQQIDSFKSSASEQNISLNEYIESVFGEYCTEDTVRLYIEQFYLATNYTGKVAVDFKPTDKEIKNYFNEHKENYYKINFSYLACTYDTTDAKTKAQSEKTVKEYMKKITDRNSIKALVPTAYKDYIDADVKSAMEMDDKLTEKEARENAISNYMNNIDGTIYSSESPFGDDINKWLFDENQPTDTVKYYVNEETGYAYIILKTEQPTLLEDETYSVRHILVTPKSEDSSSQYDTEQEYTDEQWAEAENTAKQLLEKYNSGEKTEAAFAALADSNSDDTASTSLGSSDSYGGLCENVALGQMVPTFEKWSTDKSRKYGDVEIVKSDYGYHIMYFISDRPTYEGKIITDMRNDMLSRLVQDADLREHLSVIEKADEKYLAAKKAAVAANASEGE